jgi:hypothetical protein
VWAVITTVTGDIVMVVSITTTMATTGVTDTTVIVNAAITATSVDRPPQIV